MRRGREAILKGAIQVFSRKGYSGASIREICAAAGVTKPVLYYHFKSKEHLYQDLMIDSFGYFLKALLRASKTSGALQQRLTRIVYDDLRPVKEDPWRARFLLRMVFSPEEERPYFDFVRELERQRQVIAGVFQEGIDAGELKGDARELATVLIGMDLIVILENLLTGKPILARRTAERHVNLLLRGCRAK